MQAASIILGSLCQEEFDRVDGIDSAKQIWDTLQLSHEGTKEVCEGRIHALEGELNRFIIRENETPSEMYNRLNKIAKLELLVERSGVIEMLLTRFLLHTWLDMSTFLP